MTKNLKKRHLFVAFVAVLILVSMTACKKTTDVPVSDISVDTGATTEVAETATTTDAGLYADKLLPACADGKYNYYNDLAEEQFGGYEMAGTFQDGLAAVKKMVSGCS